jgi:nardilysin
MCLPAHTRSLEREVLAVDSEFSGVQQEDACRVSQLICHTAEVGHMYRSFSWGNKKSLWDEPKAAGIDIRGEILKHYEKHYTAERMSLCVLGGESLDTQVGAGCHH